MQVTCYIARYQYHTKQDFKKKEGGKKKKTNQQTTQAQFG